MSRHVQIPTLLMSHKFKHEKRITWYVVFKWFFYSLDLFKLITNVVYLCLLFVCILWDDINRGDKSSLKTFLPTHTVARNNIATWKNTKAQITQGEGHGWEVRVVNHLKRNTNIKIRYLQDFQYREKTTY